MVFNLVAGSGLDTPVAKCSKLCLRIGQLGEFSDSRTLLTLAERSLAKPCFDILISLFILKRTENTKKRERKERKNEVKNERPKKRKLPGSTTLRGPKVLRYLLRPT